MIRGKQQKELWRWISRYVRLRDTDSHGFCTCVTCGARKIPKDIQAGHAWEKGSKRYSPIQFDTRFIFPQCKRCNKWGMLKEEVREKIQKHARMVNGNRVVDSALLLALAQGHKLTPSEIEILIIGYKIDVNMFLEKKHITKWW